MISVLVYRVTMQLVMTFHQHKEFMVAQKLAFWQSDYIYMYKICTVAISMQM